MVIKVVSHSSLCCCAIMHRTSLNCLLVDFSLSNKIHYPPLPSEKKIPIDGFQSRDTFNTWRSTSNGNRVNESSEIFIISIELMFS